MKDGTTHLAHKAEHAVDMGENSHGVILAVNVCDAAMGDTATLVDTIVAQPTENLRAVKDDERVTRACHSGQKIRRVFKQRRSRHAVRQGSAQVGELRRADFRHITICTVTIDPFTEIAAQVQHLRKIGVDVRASEPVWAVSIDDLRVYADVFEEPLVFLHYVEQRTEAFGRLSFKQRTNLIISACT